MISEEIKWLPDDPELLAVDLSTQRQGAPDKFIQLLETAFNRQLSAVEALLKAFIESDNS